MATAKRDIVDQIRDMYGPASRHSTGVPNLVPSKAALFGLDVRFKGVDDRIAKEEDRRNALSVKMKSGDNS